MMDTPHINYQSWDPPTNNTMPQTSSAPRNLAKAGSIVIALEGSSLAWVAGKSVNCLGQCERSKDEVAQGYIELKTFPISNREMSSAYFTNH